MIKFIRLHVKGFITGVFVSIALSSLVAIAATNIQGLNVFTTGTVISSAAINQNFERLAGIILFKSTTSSTSYTGSETDLFSNTTACGSSPAICRREKLSFVSSIIDNPSNLVMKTENSTLYTNYGTGSYKYYKINTDGWYEVQLRVDGFNFHNVVTTCAASSCNFNVNATIDFRAGLIDGSGDLLDNGTQHIMSSHISYGISDANANSDLNDDVVWTNNYSLGESKRVYLKAGYGIYVGLTINSYSSSATGTFNYTIPANGIEVSIIKI